MEKLNNIRMGLITSLILSIGIVDVIFIVFNKISSKLRKKSSKGLVLDSGLKSKMLTAISELNQRIKNYEKTTISKQKYNELVKKYNLLLNNYREINNKNTNLKKRIEKLKEKIY